MNWKEAYLNVFGIFYIAIAIIAFYDSIKYFGFPSVLWFSYIAFLLIGIGIITRNAFLIGSQLNIIFIPYIVWAIDFFYILFTSQSLWGITDFVFAGRFLSQIVMIQHIFIVPVALGAVYLIKFKRKDFWKWSLVQIGIIFVLTKIFTDPSKNTNCVFENCLPFEIKSFYPLIWFAAYVPAIFLINFTLTKIKAFSNKKKSH
ncbi:MAG: hypothetical protein M1416_01375 [Candidatus Pacearchaeota archaeon]|nr:hypothetical protein [Candidatus Pacearchaeota archaeon]